MKKHYQSKNLLYKYCHISGKKVTEIIKFMLYIDYKFFLKHVCHDLHENSSVLLSNGG